MHLKAWTFKVAVRKSHIVFADGLPANMRDNPVKVMGHFGVDPRKARHATLLPPADDAPHVGHTQGVRTHERTSRVPLAAVHTPVQWT